MTTLTFYNGLREIGGTFVVVETDEARCMFDFGFAVMDRMDDKIAVRYNECAADYARLGVLASQDGIYDEEAILLDLGDYKISYPVNEQLKFFMVADRFMFNNGELEDYEDMYAEFDKYLAEALVEVEKKAEPFAVEFAKKHWNDEMHYFVGAGNQWGATYSYAMCYWEEQLWLKTKSITSNEFFHGMFEIVTKETPVTIYIGEDAQRPLSERVANFIPRICENYTIIDSKDYELKGISEKYRKHLSHHVMHAVNNRIDVHMEIETRHPMEIRRYYRRLEY